MARLSYGGVALAALLGFASLRATAQTTPGGPSDGLPVYTAERLAPGERPRLDGRLDDPAWAEAVWVDAFVQREPAPGQPVSERTEAAVRYDAAALYVAFRCYVRDPATIVDPLARRDAFFATDRVSVDIDSYDDDRTAFAFAVTAGGVEQDILVYNDVDEDASWDAVWDAETARFENSEGAGYTAEFRIPFSQLRYRASAGAQTWGIQFQRDIAATGEVAFWAPILPEIEGYVSRFGRLDGLSGLTAPRRIELVPYAATQLTRAPGDLDNPFYSENDLQPNVGFDAKVGLSSNLTLTATVNPDFGQVEADPAVVNLSQFEVFFEERRPFFVEGVDIFDFGRTRTYNVANRPTFFYSRRIGRAPARFPTEGVYVDLPEQTTIAAAAKVSGKVGPWSIGFLDAVTTEEHARYIDTEGNELATPIEPFSNYLVGRLRRDFRDGASAVGAFATTTLHAQDDDALFDALLPRAALVGGLDAEHAWANRAWTLSAVASGSFISGDAGFLTRLQRAPQRYYQRPDQTYLTLDPEADRLTGWQGEVSFARTGGLWRGSLTGIGVSPGYEVNSLGFQTRADYAGLHWDLEYRQPRPRVLNYYTVYAFGGWGTNFGGDLVQHDYRGGAFARFRNLWTLSLNAGWRPDYVNDRLTRGGPLARRPSDLSGNATLRTDRSRTVWAGLRANLRRELGNDYNGAPAEWDRIVSAELAVRPTNALEVTVEPEWGVGFDNDQFFTRRADPAADATFGTRYVFSDIRQEFFDVGLRVDWTFTPELTLQFYAEPFVLSGRYTAFKEFRTPGAFDFDVYGVDKGTVTPVLEDGAITGYTVVPGDGGEPFVLGNRDFNFRSLRGNAVLRWEWRPGSTLFLVWQQTRDDFAAYDGFRVFEELGEVFRAPVENVFLIKATYWLGL